MLRLHLRDTILSLCCLLLVSSPIKAQQSLVTSDRKAKLWVYTPPGYTPAKKYPVLIFLHGEQRLPEATVNEYPHAVPPVIIARKNWDQSLPFIVLSPIASRETSVSWQTSEIAHVIDFAQRRYQVDRERIYLTGVDLGANACWTFASVYPDKIAAVVPVSASQLPAKYCELANVPSWSFQDGSSNRQERTKISTALVSMNACEKKFKGQVTWMPLPGGVGVTSVYKNRESHDIYNWMLRFTTRRLENARPYVNTINAMTVSVAKKFVYLTSEFYDADGHITNVQWKQVSGEKLPVFGLNSSNLKLQPTRTGEFVFQLSVTDNRGAVATDKVVLTVLPEKPLLISSLKLLNGRTNTEVAQVRDGLLINKTQFGISDFNIRAFTHPSVTSVRFSINMDHVTGKSERKSQYILKGSGTSWRPGNGACVVCATPYVKLNGTPEPQPSTCYRIVFTSSTSEDDGAVMPRLSIRAIDDVLISNSLGGSQWVYNGEDIPGATASIFRPLLSGEYYVRQVGRSSNEISNVVTVALQQQGIVRKEVEVQPSDTYLTIRAEALPARSYYKIMKEGKVVLEGAMNDDHRIPLTTAMPRGNYTLFLNGRKATEGITFVIH